MQSSVSRSRPVRRRVEEGLRESVLDGRFEPGTHLSDRLLCEMFGASRSVIREATRRLEAEGILQTVPNRGCVVRRIEPSEAVGIYEVRAALEGLAGEGFALRASEEDRSALRAAFEKLAKAGPSLQPGDLLHLKRDFYAVLMRGARNECNARVFEQLVNVISSLRATSLSAPGRYRQTIAEILLIVEAIERRDGEGARLACINHVHNAAAVALRILNQRSESRSAWTIEVA